MKGIGNETQDGMSVETIKKISDELKDHRFKFKPIRRIYIPKKNGDRRPLGIPGLRDKMVQKAMANVLNLHYEKVFLDTSHGFRPSRGTHSALR